MQTSSQRSSATSRGPAMYFGYCHRSKRYRMMDLPDYMSNTQEGLQRLMSDGAAAYQGAMTAYDVVPGYQGASGSGPEEMLRRYRHGDCGCGGKHGDCGCRCECCVCDADVLVHARCGELRRIPLTFENDTRRDRPVTLELGKFTHGGTDLGWSAQLTETQFTLHPCDEHTVSLLVAIRCKTDDTTTNPNNPSTNVPGTANTPSANTPSANTPSANTPSATGAPANVERPQATINRESLGLDLSAIDARLGKVDRCQVGYASIRAEGCLTRPIVVAIAVLPEDCDSFRHPCGCGCCH